MEGEEEEKKQFETVSDPRNNGGDLQLINTHSVQHFNTNTDRMAAGAGADASSLRLTTRSACNMTICNDEIRYDNEVEWVNG